MDGAPGYGHVQRTSHDDDDDKKLFSWECFMTLLFALNYLLLSI